MSEKIVQTAGRAALGEFAPDFAHFNDDVLFGENWNSGAIDLKTRCIITVVALMAQGITDSSLTYHLQNAKAHGVTKQEIAGIITHVAFYAGWPLGWAVFNLAKEVWKEDGSSAQNLSDKEKFQKEIFFPIGEPNDAFAELEISIVYLLPRDYRPGPVRHEPYRSTQICLVRRAPGQPALFHLQQCLIGLFSMLRATEQISLPIQMYVGQ